jgi:hypothetical protein
MNAKPKHPILSYLGNLIRPIVWSNCSFLYGNSSTFKAQFLVGIQGVIASGPNGHVWPFAAFNGHYGKPSKFYLGFLSDLQPTPISTSNGEVTTKIISFIASPTLRTSLRRWTWGISGFVCSSDWASIL